MIEEIKEFARINKVALVALAIIICVFFITRYTSVLSGGKSSKSNVDLAADSSEIDDLIKSIHDAQGM